MSRTARQEMVESLTERIRSSPVLFVTDFSGLNVLKLTELRRRLRANGARYIVVKNTLAQRALAANEIGALDDHLIGNTGLIFAGADPMAAAKVVGEFAREHQQPALRAGWIDGKAVAPAYIKRLGEIPPREVLLAQLLGGFNGILYQLAGVLDALREQRQQAGEATEGHGGGNMATMSNEDILEAIGHKTVLELADLVDAFKSRFNVSVAAVAAPAAGGAGAAAAAEEQTEFTVVLNAAGDKKINVIKAVREITSLGLKEAKDLVDGAPSTVKEGVTKAEAAEMKKKLEDQGATVELK